MSEGIFGIQLHDVAKGRFRCWHQTLKLCQRRITVLGRALALKDSGQGSWPFWLRLHYSGINKYTKVQCISKRTFLTFPSSFSCSNGSETWCMVSFCMIVNEESLWHDIMLPKPPRVSVETSALGSGWTDLHCEALTAKGVPHRSLCLNNARVVCMGLGFSRRQNKETVLVDTGNDTGLSVISFGFKSWFYPLFTGLNKSL